MQTAISIIMHHPETKREEFLIMIRDLEGNPPRIPRVSQIQRALVCTRVYALITECRLSWSARGAEMSLAIH